MKTKAGIIPLIAYVLAAVIANTDTGQASRLVPEDIQSEFKTAKRVKRSSGHLRAKFGIQTLNADKFKTKFISLPQANDPWTIESWDFFNSLRYEHTGDEEHYIKLDYELAHQAQLYAIQLGKLSGDANKVILQHDLSVMSTQGELLGARRHGTREQLESLPGSFPVRIWHSEIQNHTWSDNFYQSNTGHFSQAVWLNSLRVGCGRYITGDKASECEKDKWVRPPILIMVCRFSPPGNWKSKGAYKVNVLEPKFMPKNGPWDYSELCYENHYPERHPCPAPYYCCTEKSKPVEFVLPCKK